MSIPSGNWLPPGELPPFSVSLEVDVDRLSKLSHTQAFVIDEFVVIRRDIKIPVLLKTRFSSQLVIESAELVYNDTKRVNLAVTNKKHQPFGVVLEV